MLLCNLVLSSSGWGEGCVLRRLRERGLESGVDCAGGSGIGGGEGIRGFGRFCAGVGVGVDLGVPRIILPKPKKPSTRRAVDGVS